MKKKISLLLTLIVSLFIYTGTANAIVMWMQCTGDAEGSLNNYHKFDNDSQYYNKYNTVVVVNNNDREEEIKHIFYPGGTDSTTGYQKNFFTLYAPLAIANVEKVRPDKYEYNTMCWYSSYTNKEDSEGDDIDECDNSFAEGENVPISELNIGTCPVSAYEIVGGGDTAGDFLVLAGTQPAIDKEELNGYKFIYYEAKTVNPEHNLKLIETYNEDGTYGFLISLPGQEKVFTYKDIVYITNSVSRDFIANDLLYIWNTFVFSVFDLPAFGSDVDDLMNFNDDDNDDATGFAIDTEYNDAIMASQLARVYYLGRNYFKITEYDKYPRALFVNTGLKCDPNNNSECNLVVSDTVRTYENDFTSEQVWPEVKEWNKNLGDTYKKNASLLENFVGKKSESENGSIDRSNITYGKLLDNSEKIKKAIDAGKKYSFPSGYSVEMMVKDFSSALKDLKIILADDDNNNGGKYYNYEFKNNKCEQSAKTDKAIDSISSYVTCRLFENTDALSLYGSFNRKGLRYTFISALNDQLNLLNGSDVDFINLDNIIRDYVISLTRAILYINANYPEYAGDADFAAVMNGYQELCRHKYKIEVIIDCNTLLGDRLLEKLDKYFDIIKIAVPIILIGFGILDFAKAVFTSDAEKMKAAQKKFLMRIIIAIIFFLSPILIKLLLNIANKAWNFISPNGCDIS